MRIKRPPPLLIYTPPFLLGQYSFSPDATTAAVVALTLLLSCMALRQGRGFMAIVAFTVGVLSYHLQNQAVDAEFSGQGLKRRVVATILYPIRRKRTGEVELRLKLQSDEQGNVLSGEVFCIGKDLPWKYEGLAKAGEVRAFYLKWRGSFKGRCKILATSKELGSHMGIIREIREGVRVGIREHLGNNEASGVLRALLLAERDAVSSRTAQSFKRLGISHLLVVSGYHLSLFYSSGYLILYPLCVLLLSNGLVLSARRLAALAAFCITTLYAFLCHPQPSLIRALVSLALFFCMTQLGRKGAILSSLLFALLVIVTLWPLSFLTPSVQLTFSALTAIWVSSSFLSRGDYSIACRYFITSSAISLFTGCCSLIWFGEFSFIGVFMNIFIAPLLAFICCKLGMLGLVLYMSGIDSEGYLLTAVWHITNLSLGWIGDVAEWNYVAYPFS